MAKIVCAGFYQHVSNHIVSDVGLCCLGKNAFPQCTTMDLDTGNHSFGRHRRCKSYSGIAVHLRMERQNKPHDYQSRNG